LLNFHFINYFLPALAGALGVRESLFGGDFTKRPSEIETEPDLQEIGCGAAARRCGLTGCDPHTSWNYRKGSLPTRWRETVKLRSTAPVLPPSSLPKNTHLFPLCSREHNAEHF
jgi:hypothetical protein